MKPRDLIWNVISESYDESGIIPSWNDIAIALEDKVSLEAFELIDDVVNQFLSIHTKGEVVNG